MTKGTRTAAGSGNGPRQIKERDKEMKYIFKKVYSYYRWLLNSYEREDDVNRELRQDIIEWNLEEEEEQKLFDYFRI